jgi:protein O-mannosyl-transferase
MSAKKVHLGQRPDARRDYWREHRVIALIVLVAGLVYANTLSNRFVFDDLDLIPNNSLAHDATELGAIFGGPYQFQERPATLYRPLAIWTIAANTGINRVAGNAGPEPFVFRLTNLLLHAAVSGLLYYWLISLQFPVRLSLAAALLFAVHPIHTEAVASVVNRSELLAALFGLLLLLCHRQRRHPVGCALLLLLALWSKESAIAIVPVLILMDGFFRVPNRVVPIAAYTIYAATAAGWLALRARVLSGELQVFPFLDNPLVTASVLPRLYTAARVQVDYLRLQILPVGLSSDYSHNQISVIQVASSPYVLLFLALCAGFAVLGWKAWRSGHQAVPFLLLSYAVLFVPTSNVLMPIGTIMAERLAYFPSMMFSVAVSYGAWLLYRRSPRATTAAFLVVLGIFSALTIMRNQTWSDELTFYTAQVESAPESARAHFAYGSALATVSKSDRAAVAEYEQALQIYPHYSDAHFNMGNALRRLGGDPERVIAAYRSAIRIDNSHTNALVNLGRFLVQHGRMEEARSVLEQLKQIDPGNSIFTQLAR